MLKWKDEYVIGIKEIDEQHENLFKIAGRAFEILKNDFCMDKYDKIVEILEELKEYTIFHFHNEETYMEKIGYKKLFTHKIEHTEFIEKINNVDLKKMDQEQDFYLLEIMEFVVNWIENHILEEDKLYF